MCDNGVWGDIAITCERVMCGEFLPLSAAYAVSANSSSYAAVATTLPLEVSLSVQALTSFSAWGQAGATAHHAHCGYQNYFHFNG